MGFLDSSQGLHRAGDYHSTIFGRKLLSRPPSGQSRKILMIGASKVHDSHRIDTIVKGGSKPIGIRPSRDLPGRNTRWLRSAVRMDRSRIRRGNGVFRTAASGLRASVEYLSRSPQHCDVDHAVPFRRAATHVYISRPSFAIRMERHRLSRRDSRSHEGTGEVFTKSTTQCEVSNSDRYGSADGTGFCRIGRSRLARQEHFAAQQVIRKLFFSFQRC